MSTKDDVLAFLEKREATDVSGQEIADALGLSRNAVWRAVSSLRDEGYAIESGTNRGYRLTAPTDALSAHEIERFLTGKATDLDVRVMPEVDSTNNEAKRLLAAGETGGLLIATGHQTAGRGRRGRAFASPAGGVYFSLLLDCGLAASDAVKATMAAAVAVARCVERLCDSGEAKIKWVNDVLVGGLKVCGILTEGIADVESGTISSMVVGIGVNVGTELLAELEGVAGTLDLAPGTTRSQLVAAIASELISLMPTAGGKTDPELAAEYRERSCVVGREVDCVRGSESFHALALDIDDDGALVVQTDGGERIRLRDGEISVRPA